METIHMRSDSKRERITHSVGVGGPMTLHTIDGVIRSIWTDNPLPTFDELETALLDAMPFGMNPNEFQKKMADQPS